MDFLKAIAGKLVTGAVVLAVVAAGISWYEADAQTRSALLSGVSRAAAWLGIVLVVPWVTFALIGWVARMDQNLAGGVLVGVYAVAEAVALGAIFRWNVRGEAGWSFFVLGALFAAAYNLFACDWIAEKVV